MLNWKGCDKGQLWPDYGYSTCICFLGLRKATESVVYGIRNLGRSLDGRPSEYEAWVLTAEEATFGIVFYCVSLMYEYVYRLVVVVDTLMGDAIQGG